MSDGTKPISSKHPKTTLISLAFLATGVIIGVITTNFATSYTPENGCSSNLMFVRSEPDCESFKNATDRMQNLQDTLKRQVSGYLGTKRADRISVFVRDLNNQRFSQVNETEEFYMASLLKIPLAVAYFRLAELTPDLLEQRVSYDGSFDATLTQGIQPLEKLTKGEYPIDDLIFRALAFSDNTSATLLLKNYISYDYLQRILFTLGIQPSAKDQSQNLITARSAAGMFRTLYNSSFISREYSDRILEILSKSTFTEGSTALLPKDVQVSHKFAERSFVNDLGQTVRELHDCGILYTQDTNQAYSFCIMTEGKNLTDLKSIIGNIALTTYNKLRE